MKDSMNNSLVKAITILNSFSYEQPRLRLKDISGKTGINQATSYRMLNTLKEYGLIEQQEGLYSLGQGFLKYEGIVLSSIEIRRIALPLLEELSNSLKVNANLAVLDKTEVVYVARAGTTYSSQGNFPIGMRSPIYCTALGKVLTCNSPDTVLEVFRRGVTRYTFNTITDSAAFLKELEVVRLQGYAVDREEWSNGINCVAVPLYNSKREIVGGLSTSGPTSRCSIEKIREFVPNLLEYAHRISARMGACTGW